MLFLVTERQRSPANCNNRADFKNQKGNYGAAKSQRMSFQASQLLGFDALCGSNIEKKDTFSVFI